MSLARVRTVSLAVAVTLLLALLPVTSAVGQDAGTGADAPASELVQRRERVRMPDGAELEVKLGGHAVGGELPPRPAIVEFTPYAPGDCPTRYGEAYHHLCVHVRGTGASTGAFDMLGPAAQSDVVETLRWACAQPWSDGTLGLWGFSASAIVIYNSMHLELPCVETAVLGSGTHELYRDLLYPGGIPNMVPALGVLGLIAAPMVPAGQQRLEHDPASVVPAIAGLGSTVTSFLLHPTLDRFWQERGFRGDANQLPILMSDGFFDVESRGAFQAFQELRDNGAHLRVYGAHDGIPGGAPDLHREERRWYDQHLRGIDTGILDEPRVQLLLADGEREAMLADDAFVAVDADDWPVPGTRWSTLHLDAGRTGTARSLNDGALSLTPGRSVAAGGPTITSLGTATDPYTTSILGVFDGTGLTDTRLADPGGLTWTSEPLTEDVLLAGPGSVELVLRSTSPETDLFVVVSDVWPDGSSKPMAAGRLRSSFPHVDLDRSLVDERGTVVQPYADLSAKDPVRVLDEHRYHVELWPIGNRFKEGHRLRLHLVGASTYHLPTLPALHRVRLGEGGSQLHLPVLPGSDLVRALGGDPELGDDPAQGCPVPEHARDRGRVPDAVCERAGGPGR